MIKTSRPVNWMCVLVLGQKLFISLGGDKSVAGKVWPYLVILIFTEEQKMGFSVGFYLCSTV